MNILPNDKEFLKYRLKLYLIKKINKRGLYNRPVYNNEYIKTKIWALHENFHGNKKLTKDKYNDHSILLIKSVCEAENNHYFLENIIMCLVYLMN